MAGSVNKVTLIGNLGRDPEVKTFSNGARYANLSIATSESWRDKATGERKERTEWHRVVVFNEALVSIAEKYLRKGSKVFIEGLLATREYEKDGRKSYTTEVVLRPYRGELVLLDSQSTRPPDGTAEDYELATASRSPSSSAGTPAMDDEIPF